MNELTIDVPTFASIVGTRAALGIGVGLLLAERIPADRRRAVVGALVAVGAATTIPLAMRVFRGLRTADRHTPAGIDHDDRLIGATRLARKGDDWY